RRDSDEELRYWTAHALVCTGPSAGSAVPVLAKCLHDPSARVRQEAGTALNAIGRKASTRHEVLREIRHHVIVPYIVAGTDGIGAPPALTPIGHSLDGGTSANGAPGYGFLLITAKLTQRTTVLISLRYLHYRSDGNRLK